MKAAKGAADPAKVSAMTIHSDDPSGLRHSSTSPTERVLAELQLYGYRPFEGEPDPRPLPDARSITGAVADMFDALVATLSDTRLEPDLEELLWSTVNLFHRAVLRIERALDDNEAAQKRSQKEQDGSEIRSVELERLIAEGRHADRAPRQYGALPRRGRRPIRAPNRLSLATALGLQGQSPRPDVGDDRQPRFPRRQTSRRIRARCFRRAPRSPSPAGSTSTITARSGIASTRPAPNIPTWCSCTAARPKGAERIAACWADNRKVPQIVFKPDWKRHAKAAPFKRNDQMLATLPIGVIVFPGSGISANLADKARMLGIPVWKFSEGGA